MSTQHYSDPRSNAKHLKRLYEKIFYLTEDHKTHGNIIKRIKKKYPNLDYNCDSNKKIVIEYHKTQEKLKSDTFIFSLRIIPEIIIVEYFIKIYSPNNDLIYKYSSSGKIALSIFLIPIFFIHKWEDEIVFDKINIFLQTIT